MLLLVWRRWGRWGWRGLVMRVYALLLLKRLLHALLDRCTTWYARLLLHMRLLLLLRMLLQMQVRPLLHTLLQMLLRMLLLQRCTATRGFASALLGASLGWQLRHYWPRSHRVSHGRQAVNDPRARSVPRNGCSTVPRSRVIPWSLDHADDAPRCAAARRDMRCVCVAAILPGAWRWQHRQRARRARRCIMVGAADVARVTGGGGWHQRVLLDSLLLDEDWCRWNVGVRTGKGARTRVRVRTEVSQL